MMCSKLRLVFSVLCLFLVSCTQAQEPAVSPSGRLPAPSEAELDEATATLKRVYTSEYRRTEDKNAVNAGFAALSLARKLIKTSEETPPESQAYYAMLFEAARLATIGDKPDVAFDAIDRLLKTHDFDASELRLIVLNYFGHKATRLSDIKLASRFVMPAIQGAADAQKIETAQEMLKAGEAMARRTLDRALKQDLAQASELLEILAKQDAEVDAALKKIEKDDEDPEAHLTIAKFVGLRRGDWETAEAHAAWVDEEAVRSLFVREFAAPQDVNEILTLANDWWEFAQTETGAVKLQATELAAIRYASIVKQLKGFDQKQVETRLAGVIRDHVVAVRMPVVIRSTEPAKPQPAFPELQGTVLRATFEADSVKEGGIVEDLSDAGNNLLIHASGSLSTDGGLSGQFLRCRGEGSAAICTTRRFPEDFRPLSLHLLVRGSESTKDGSLFFYGDSKNGRAATYVLLRPEQIIWSGGSSDLYIKRTFDDGKWHQLIGTWDGKTAEVFIDGKLVGQHSKVIYRPNLTEFCKLGVNWKGDLDEVMYFDRALGDQEIQALSQHFRQMTGAK